MQQGQKAKTSVFSQYQNNENDSISSKQLQFWLKQTAPNTHQKLGIQWTLMSTNSIYEQDQHNLQRTDTFESINKQNDSKAFNSIKIKNNNSSNATKSKSYLNAMVDLQNKVKQLQNQNNSLKYSVKALREEKEKNLQNSSLVNQQLKHRIDALEPKTKKLEEYSRENKKLRDWKEQNLRKIKIMEKIIKQSQTKTIQYEKKCQRLESQLQSSQNKNTELQKINTQNVSSMDKQKEKIEKYQERVKILEDMKERSTSSIIQKYGASVEMTSSLTQQNNMLRNQIEKIKSTFNRQIKQIQEKHNSEKQEFLLTIEKLKHQNAEKADKIIILSKQGKQYKQKYFQSNNELKTALKNHTEQIKHLKQLQIQQLQEAKLSLEKNNIMKSIIKQSEQLNKVSVIVQTVEQPKQIQSQLQFEEEPSIEQEQEEEQEEPIQPYLQTRSLGKTNHRTNQKQNIFISDCASQQNYYPPYVSHTKTGRKISHPIAQTIQKTQKTNKIMNSNSQQKRISNLKANTNSKSKSKSRSKSKQIEKKNNQNEKSFILKSCEPITQRQYVQIIPNQRYPPQYYSASINNTKQHIPYYWQTAQVGEFVSSNRQSNENSIEKALLVEVNKQIIRLIQEQEKTIYILNENCTPNQRAENVGRMKQISQQIRISNQRMLQLKRKASGQ